MAATIATVTAATSITLITAATAVRAAVALGSLTPVNRAGLPAAASPPAPPLSSAGCSRRCPASGCWPAGLPAAAGPPVGRRWPPLAGQSATGRRHGRARASAAMQPEQPSTMPFTSDGKLRTPAFKFESLFE